MSWWDAVIEYLPAITSAVSSMNQSDAAKDASRASQAGINAATAEQRRQFDIMMEMLQPQRQLGTNAINTLSRLYGYAPSSGGSAIGSSGIGVNSAGGITQGIPPVSGSNALAPTGYDRPVVDPKTGQVIPMPAGLLQRVQDAGNRLGAQGARMGLSAEDNAYLQAYRDAYIGQSGISRVAGGLLDVAGSAAPVFGIVKDAVDASNARAPTGAPGDYGITGTGTTNGSSAVGGLTPTGSGQPDMSVFFSSPDYGFRRSEGTRDINNSFAARGGALSGNALRGITDFNSNLASGEFNNFVQRQLQMAGLGGAATSQAVNSAQYTGGNISNLLQAGGNARASGIVDQSNAQTNGLNDLATWFGNWSKNRNTGTGTNWAGQSTTGGWWA